MKFCTDIDNRNINNSPNHLLYNYCTSDKALVAYSDIENDNENGVQVNLNELDQQMEAIKEMFVKKQEMMKKMSTMEVNLIQN
jgi:hypothetical protein